MTRLGQKIQERWQLERLIEAMGDAAPAPAAAFGDSENPDFILPRPDGSTLGIEITVLHHPRQPNGRMPLRQEEGIQERICRGVEQRWKQSGIPLGEVSIHFLGRNLPSKKDEPQVVDALLSVIRRVDKLVEGTANIDRDKLWHHPLLGGLVQSITVARWQGYERPYVHAPCGAFLPSLSSTILQESISKKSSRCSEYRENCDEVWLVMVHNESGLATHFDRREVDVSAPFETEFDRVWLLNSIGKRVLEVGRVNE